MKRTSILISLAFLTLIFVTSTASPWGSATHAYIADHIGKKIGLENLNEIYGAMLPDLFNYAFSLPNQSFFHDLTHGVPPYDESFLAIWNTAGTPVEFSLAYGFVCHNDVWAADFTAHWNSRTLRSSKEYDKGYIITKSIELEEILDLTSLLGVPYDVAIELNHNLLETAGDIIITRYDKDIGQKIIAAATTSPQGDAISLLDNAYGLAVLLPPGVLQFIEMSFRNSMIGYGGILSFDEIIQVQMFSELLRSLAAEYLGVDPDDLPPAEVISEMLYAAVDLLEKDYMREIRATVGFVRSRLANHGIFY